MRRSILFYLLFISIFGLAQAPQKFSYQTVIRNGSNQLLTNQQVGIKISVLQGSETGIVVYSERHTPSTNANGLATLSIGTGSVLSGNFLNINWSSGSYYIQTETDPNGGNSYTIISTQQLLSVPYALYAETSGSSTPGPQGEQGPIGETGPQGLTGSIGSTGETGAAGSNGKNSLVKTSNELAGATCSTGGVKMEYGIDANGNGILEESEVNNTLTKYVCNGAVGEQGPQGIQGEAGPQGETGLSNIITGPGIEISEDTIRSTCYPKFIPNIYLFDLSINNSAQIWNTVNLSSYIPSSSQFAIIRLYASSSEYYSLNFRKNEFASPLYNPSLGTAPNSSIHEDQFIIPLNSDSSFEYLFYKVAGNTSGNLTIILIGYL